MQRTHHAEDFTLTIHIKPAMDRATRRRLRRLIRRTRTELADIEAHAEANNLMPLDFSIDHSIRNIDVAESAF